MANVDVLSQLYNVAAVYAGPSPATAYMFSSGNSGINLLQQIPRVQSVGVGFKINRQDAYQLGQMARVGQIITSPPSVTLNLDYLLVDGKAEQVLGLNIDPSQTFISGVLDRTTDEKNYFVLITPEGTDAVGNTATGNSNVISVGNGFLTNYSLSASIGSLPKATVSIEGANFQSYTGCYAKPSPAIDQNLDVPVSGPLFTIPTAIAYTGVNTPVALRPGEVSLYIPRNAGVGDYMSGVGKLAINGFSLSVPINRDVITPLGKFFPASRKLRPPVPVTVSFDAYAGDVAEGSISALRCSDAPVSFEIGMQKPNCGGGTGVDSIHLWIKNAKLESRDFSLAAGGGAGTVRLSYSAQMSAIGGKDGIFFSGSAPWNPSF